MAQLPSMPLFIDAYLADTIHLTAAQHGAYLLLLMMAWRQPDCSLPNDDKILSRWAFMDLRTWQKNKDTVLSFWNLGVDNKWRQGRLCDERKYVDDKRKKNVQAGQASALKRLNRDATNVERTLNERSTPIPIPITKPKGLETDVSQTPQTFIDERDRLRREGADILTSLGIAKPHPMIGRWLKQTNDNPQTVLQAIHAALEQRVLDPVPWITQAITARQKQAKERTNEFKSAINAHRERFGIASRENTIS